MNYEGTINANFETIIRCLKTNRSFLINKIKILTSKNKTESTMELKDLVYKLDVIENEILSVMRSSRFWQEYERRIYEDSIRQFNFSKNIFIKI